MLCGAHNKLRAEVNRLQDENSELKKQNDRLEESEKKLKETEAKLQEITVLQGKNVDELVRQVQEWKKIQAEVKKSLEAKIMQNLMDVVLRSDRDQDNLIDPEEVDGLMLRLKQIEGVEFSETNFKKALNKEGFKVKEGGYDVMIVIEIMKNLFDENTSEEDNIFNIKTEDVAAG